jgi:tol-pal system protein YbgF
VKSFSCLLISFCIFLTVNATVYGADADIIQRLDRIERLLQSQGLLDMLQQIEALQQEISSLHGDMEFQNHTLDQLKKRQRDLYTDIDQRLQGLERGGVADSEISTDISLLEITDDSVPPLQTLKPVAGNIPVNSASQETKSTLQVEVLENTSTPMLRPAMEREVATVVPTATSASGSDTLTPIDATVELDPVQLRAQYQQAFKLLKKSQYEQAIKAFREFLLEHPQSEYSDNAQYWLGEAYYVTREFEQALIEYNNLVSNYPESKKLSHSLLKIGFCYYEMGSLDKSTTRLEELKQNYPGTTAARLAEERLKKIAQEVSQPATIEVE